MSMVSEPIVRISKRKIRALIKNPVKSAQAVNLVYVNDSKPGIRRIKKGASFEYFLGDNQVADEENC